MMFIRSKSITLTYAATASGRNVTLDGQGFGHEEDGCVQDHWTSNKTPSGTYFWLDNGAEFHAREQWVDETAD